MDKGASLRDRAFAASPSSPSVSPVPASIPSADLPTIRRLIAQCEQPGASVWSAIDAVARYIGGDRQRIAVKFNDVNAYLDAAAALLPPGAVWRAYTDRGVSVYGASPYNAAAQQRFDGLADERPLALLAALLRLIEAPLVRAQAIEARRAETARQAPSQDESAVRKDAPNA